MCDIKPCLHDTTCCTTGCTTCCTTGYTTGCIAYTQQDGDRYKPYEHKIPTHSSHVSFLELPKFCLTFSILVACIQLRCLHSALVALGRSCASQISVTIRNTKQPQGLSRSDGKCPDGLTLVPWQSGKPLVWNVTVICPLADSYSLGGPGTIFYSEDGSIEQNCQLCWAHSRLPLPADDDDRAMTC